MNDIEKYSNLKRETEVIGHTHDLLKLGTFPGHLAEKVAISQMYLQGLYKQMSNELSKLAPAVEPIQPQEMSGKPLEMNLTGVVSDSTDLPELVSTEVKA